LINSITIIFIALTSPVDVDLQKATNRYASAPGIQWEITSIIHSDIFEESDTSKINLIYNPADSFYMKSDSETLIGLGDTLWIISDKHKQVQKRILTDYARPIDFIMNWNSNYDIDSAIVRGDNRQFYLTGRPGATPSNVVLFTNKNGKLRRITYKDSAGSLINLIIEKEKLRNYSKTNIFELKSPPGYKQIDLTE